MSSIAIGDIHGNFLALDNLLDYLAPYIRAEDTIVFLGDYIDRGPDSKKCIDRILSLRSYYHERVVTLLGNHEQWMMRTYEDHASHSWLFGMEAFNTIRSYSPDAERRLQNEAAKEALRPITDGVPLPYKIFFEAVPREHIEFFFGGV